MINAPARHPAATTIDQPRALELLRIYSVLTKARLSMLVLLTTTVGFVMGSVGHFDGLRLLWTILGTAMTAGAANALNEIIEARRDALMHRTRNRPLPAGAISRSHALIFALVLCVVGTVILLTLVNLLAAMLALGTVILYAAVYTPLKTRSSTNTLIGAVCGATPPLIGWVGATGMIDNRAWILAGLLFVWQLPHFLALAWLYRDDYQRGDYAMLPVFDPAGNLTCTVVVLTSLVLLPIGLASSLVGLTGWVYAIIALALGCWMLGRAIRLLQTRSHADARRVFLASIVYLSVLLLVMMVDRAPAAITHNNTMAMRDVPALSQAPFPAPATEIVQ